MHRTRDVVVIGAGIAGSSMAKALAERGWDVVLIDGQHFPRHKVCGEFLSPESQSMLHALGFQEAVDLLQPAKIHRARVIWRTGEALDTPLPGTAIGISRFALDTALQQLAMKSGAELITGQKVDSVTRSEEGYVVKTRDFFLRTRAVIAAWGGRGAPKVSGQRTPDSDYIGVKSHFTGVRLRPAVELFFFPGGYLGLSPVEGGVVNAAALLKKSTFHNKEKTVIGLIREAGKRNPQLNALLEQAMPVPGTQAAVAPVKLNRRPAAWEQFPLVGDAIVTIPPLCGDGMSMALRSVCLCAPLADRYLRGESTLVDWMQEYTSLLKCQFNGPLRWGLLLQRLSTVPLLPRIMLRAARSFPALPASLVRATRLKEID